MNIYLVRHGETDWNNRLLFQGHSDTRLNRNGKKQAKRIASGLKSAAITLIISSDLKRAYETARVIKKETMTAGRIIKEPLLRERDYGSLEGKHYKDRVKRNAFSGEKDSEFFPRVKKALKKILKYSRGHNTVCVVTHGGFIRVLAAVILGLPGERYKRIRLYNASISKIHYDAEKRMFFITLLNSVSHLTKAEQKKAEFHIKGI